MCKHEDKIQLGTDGINVRYECALCGYVWVETKESEVTKQSLFKKLLNWR